MFDSSLGLADRWARRRLAAIPCAGARSSTKEFLAETVGPWPPRDSALVLNTVRLMDDGVYTLSVVELRARLAPLRTIAYVAEPKAAEIVGTAVLVHGPGILPYQAFGVRLAGDDTLAFYPQAPLLTAVARSLLRRRLRVVAVNISDDIFDFPAFSWREIDRHGVAWNVRDPSGNALRIVLDEVLTAVDYAAERGAGGIAIVGWEHSGNIASYAAAIDTRIGAIVRIGPMLDRARMRRDPGGVMLGPSFMASDCSQDDAEIVGANAPKPQMVIYRRGNLVDARLLPYIDTSATRRATAAYARLGSRNLTSTVIAEDDEAEPHLDPWMEAFVPGDSSARLPPPGLNTIRGSYPFLMMDRWRISLDNLMDRWREGASDTPGSMGGICRMPDDSIEVQRPSADASLRSRQRPLGALLVDTLNRPPGFDLLWIRESEAERLPVNAIALVPRDGGNGSVLVSFNGADDLSALTGEAREGTEYLNAYAAALARLGFTVVVPVIPAWYPELSSSLGLAKARQMTTGMQDHFALADRSVWAIESITGMPGTHRIAYGISYGGAAALFYTASHSAVSLLVYSNPVSTPSLFFSNDNASGLATWYSAICAPFERTLLDGVRPRPLIWENGARDINGPESEPLDFVNRVRQRYRSFGFEETPFEFIRHGGAHATRPGQQLIDAVFRQLARSRR